MNAFVVGLYGLFFIMVGAKRNEIRLIDEIKTDVNGFVPWAIAIAVLAALSEYEETNKLVKPFVALLILNFVLVNYDTMRIEFRKLTNTGNQ